MPSVSMAVSSESRPLLSASPRQSMEDISTEWTSTSESTVSFNTGFSRVTFGSHDHNISIPSIGAKGDYGSPQPISHTKSQNSGFIDSPTTDSNGLPSGVASCGTSRSNEQDRRVWISAENRFKNCGHTHRTLVLCFDGTGDQFDDDNSNIVQFLAMLRKDDNTRQLVYYQAGLGTYTDPVLSAPVASQLSMTLDQMVAWNLGSHVKDGYAFLMQNYTRGDKICIFGFSRGAYTARALAGMLQKVGLLPTCNHQQLPFAYDMYKREDKEGLDMSHAFKKTYSRSVAVDFLGVWDTVASVGLIPHYLPFIHENSGIRHLRHALALDERRVKFLPQFCGGAKPEAPEVVEDHMPHWHHRTPHRSDSLKKSYENLINAKAGEKTDAEEVWFAGVHCDVGGGATANWIEYKLARIPLRWMIRECFDCNTGILFDARMLQRVGLPVYKDDTTQRITLAPLYKWNPAPAPLAKPTMKPSWWQALLASLFYPFCLFGRLFFTRTPKVEKPDTADDDDLHEYDLEDIDPNSYEYENDLKDCRTETHDQLEKKLLWIILDWIPQRVKKQKAIINILESGDSYKWLWNRGRGRKIPKTEIEEGLKVHRSVKMRLEELGEDYVPQARPNIRIARLDENGKKIKEPRRMTHAEWNNPEPQQWKWVADK